jgi:hypothetical protein
MEVEVDGAVVEAAAGVETGEELNTVESVVFQIIEGKLDQTIIQFHPSN